MDGESKSVLKRGELSGRYPLVVYLRKTKFEELFWKFRRIRPGITDHGPPPQLSLGKEGYNVLGPCPSRAL
jgi:hypothetical protein